MRDPLGRRVRWLFSAAAALFAILGVASLVAETSWLSDDLPPSVAMRLVASLGVAYGTIAAFLALTIARAPRRHTSFMPLVSASLFAAGASLLVSRVAEPPASPELDRFVLGGAIAALLLGALVLGAWIRLWLADVPGDIRRVRDERALEAFLDALVPAGGAVVAGANEASLAERIQARRQGSGRAAALRLRLEVRLIDLASRLLAGAPLAEISPEARQAFLQRLSTTWLSPLRHLHDGWRRAALITFYEDPGVQDAIGFDRGYLERKLEDGPNRDARRARRERATAMEEGGVVEVEEKAAASPREQQSAPTLTLVRTGPAPG